MKSALADVPPPENDDVLAAELRHAIAVGGNYTASGAELDHTLTPTALLTRASDHMVDAAINAHAVQLVARRAGRYDIDDYVHEIVEKLCASVTAAIRLTH